jgi:hypothetical protein
MKLTVDINIIKRKFFASCNCILGNVKCLNDIIKLNMMESYCLPILLYATAALDLQQQQLADLNAGWNSVYRRIFGFNRWESVKSFIAGIGRLNFCYLRMYLYIKFCKFGLSSSNKVFSSLICRHVATNEFRLRCNVYGLENVQYNRLLCLSVNRLHALLTLAFKNSC